MTPPPKIFQSRHGHIGGETDLKLSGCCIPPSTYNFYISDFVYRRPKVRSISSPWPSGYKRRNPTLVPVVKARFEPRSGRPHFAPTCNGVRVCGRNRTEAREREWTKGTVSSLPGTLNFRIKFCHSTEIARSGGGVRASTTSYA